MSRLTLHRPPDHAEDAPERSHVAATHPRPREVPAHTREAAHPRRTVTLLWARLVRRATLVLAVGVAAYAAVEVASYTISYPNGVSAQQFALFEDNPAIRMITGVPVALDTAGGFAVWDGGLFMQLILVVWGILTASRLLRGEEDAERIELVLGAPLRATTAMVSALAVMAGAALLVGASATAALLAGSTAASGAVLYGLGLAGVAATFIGVTAVTSQLVNVRRRAAGFAAGVLVLSFVLRMIGNSTDDRLWVRWTTPLGWIDVLQPYGSPDLRALVPLVVVPVLLGVLAVALRTRRDVGGALLAGDTARAPHLRLLGSSVAFAWRSNRAVLAAWFVGLVAMSVIYGALTSTMIDWLAKDADYQRTFAALGLDSALTTLGFVALMSTMFGVAVALQVTWRLGSARAEEESGRADNILSRPVSRVRWLSGHVALALAGGVLLLVASGVAMWAGLVAGGTDTVTWTDGVRAMVNSLPVVVLVAGFTVLTYGVVPRLTVALPVTLTIVGYLLTLLGPALTWPSWVLDLSPWTHLAWVPAADWAATSGIVMTVLGLAMLVLGTLLFHRRDVTGA